MAPALRAWNPPVHQAIPRQSGNARCDEPSLAGSLVPVDCGGGAL